MRPVGYRCRLLGCAIAFAGLALLDAVSASAQPVTSAEPPCGGTEYLTDVGLVDTRFRRPLDLFRIAEEAPADRATELHERAAAAMEAAIEARPDHRLAALARFYVALALERSGRPRSAMERYVRITRDYDSIHGVAGCLLDREDRSQRLSILEASAFRAAINAGRLCEFDEALRLYREFVRDERFASVADHAEHVRDAVATIVLLGQHSDRRTQARPTLAAAARIEARLARATTPTQVAALAVELEVMTRLSRLSSVAARVGLGDAYGRLADLSSEGRGAQWRRLAIEHYATAVHHARESALPSTAAERALDRLHDDEYRRRLGEVLVHQRRFPYRPGEFADHPPVALVMEASSVAMPMLIGLTP